VSEWSADDGRELMVEDGRELTPDEVDCNNSGALSLMVMMGVGISDIPPERVGSDGRKSPAPTRPEFVFARAMLDGTN
jgi:hypothetical protein